MTRERFTRALVALFAVFLLFGMTVPGSVAAADTEPITDNLNTGDYDEEGVAPNPVFKVDVTTDDQDLSQGTDDASIMGYEGDNGEWIDGADTPFTFNDTMDISTGGNVNPYSFEPAYIEDTSHQAFPEGHDENTDWLNSSSGVWVVSNDGANNLTVSETSITPGVDAIRFNTGTSGDSATDGQVMYEATYNSWTSGLDSDESKRVLQLGGQIDTLEANTEFQVRIYDESGSYKEVIANTSGTAFSGNQFATSTGTFAYQVKLNTLSTQGSDTTWDNIENITVRQVADGSSNADSDVSIAWMDLRKKSKNKLGEQRATTDDDGNDEDSDGDYDEFQTIYNATDSISVHSMETLDSEYDDAIIHDLTYPAHFEAAGLDQRGEDGDYVYEFENASYPSFHEELNLTVQLKLPSVIDLSYSNAELNMTQRWNDDRYITAAHAEDVADSTDLSDADTTSFKDSLQSSGDEIQLDASINAGENHVIHYVIQLTEDEVENDVKATADGGDEVAPPPSDEDGGMLSRLVSFVTTIPGAVLSIVSGFAIWRWIGKRRSG